MKNLLERQIQRHLAGVDVTQSPWREFLAAVAATYREADQDRDFLAHTLEVTSAELTEANERLRAESESKLAALHHAYRQTLEAQQGMILCLRRTPRGFEHTLCLGQLLARLGLTAGDLDGRLIDEVAPPPQAAQLNAAFTRAWAGESLAFSFTTSDGIDLFISCRPRLERGAVQEIIASCVEITALTQAERELRAAKERAEAADRAKSEFLAVMSHEIRTPLNAVLGFTSLLQESRLTAEQHGWLETVAASGETLLALINDILDFSKIEAGRLTLAAEPVALSAVLDAVLSMFAPRAAAKGLALQLHAAPDLPAAVVTDDQRLRQILINLVGNAVKFTERGAVDLTVRVAAPAPTPEGVVTLGFEVRDTGIGIPPGQRDRLFKPFSQVDSSSTRAFGGTGLGLAICDRLVRMLGGEIGFESEPGRGSRFHFTIRAEVVSLADPPDAGAAPAPAPSRPRLRVLVAEDNPHNQLFMRHALSARGVEAVIVGDGRAAIAAAEAQRYDLILMDLRMPDIDGCDATRAIRQSRTLNSTTKIFALTANVFPEDRRRCTVAGMDGLLMKPLELRLLYELLDTLAPKD